MFIPRVDVAPINPGPIGYLIMRQLLEEKLQRFNQLEAQLVDPEVLASGPKLAVVAREHGSLAKLATKYRRFKDVNAEISDTREMTAGDDPEMRELAEAELPTLIEERETLWDELLLQTIGGEDANRTRCVMEIRAGTGGDEAALFAADLFRMYVRYAESRRWRTEVLDSNPTGMGGYKEIICSVEADGAFSRLKFEGGVHRVQRVPQTEASGRIHTSAVTVAVLPEADQAFALLVGVQLEGGLPWWDVTFEGVRFTEFTATQQEIVLNLNDSLHGWFWQFLNGLRLENLSEIISEFPQKAGFRAIVIGIALGVVSTSLKVILGVDRSYLGSE